MRTIHYIWLSCQLYCREETGRMFSSIRLMINTTYHALSWWTLNQELLTEYKTVTTGTSTTTKTYSYQIMEGVREITGPAGIIRSAYMDFGLVHIFLYLNKYSDFSIFFIFFKCNPGGLGPSSKRVLPYDRCYVTTK